MKNQTQIQNLISEFNEVRKSQRQSFASAKDWLQHGKDIAKNKAAILKQIESLSN